jgi:FlaA1/EpsC-like NDP-sugar epimerase
MVRYFMTIPEAVSLILQASTMGEGGEVFVLDMGEPVKIVELAEELIRIHGLKPYVDVDIQFTGVRPGEKIFEEILTAEEGTVASKHEKVFIARNSVKYSLPQIEKSSMNRRGHQ